ncbi:hypothetical protein TWF481_009915 [Arthrobotrys musiformis]|uniref:Hydrophobin n=1 Tax=Arthrobotrys musiformis TaxID=47236 RepID=A0AAV9W7C0_9PEZI
MLASTHHILILVFMLLTKAFAWTLPLGLGSSEAPSALRVQNPSPQCTSINNGALLCCTAAVSGGFPLVVLASQAANYNLPQNTLNGYICFPSSTTACSGTQLPLCCQVTTLTPLWGLWCQSATSTCTPISNP